MQKEARFKAGDWLGPYELLFKLGAGGAGQVWAARRGGSRGFAKCIALKILFETDVESELAARFVDEARVTAALQHSSIVRTYDFGQGKGVFYIAMDMVRGPSLAATLQRLAIAKRFMSPKLVAYIGLKIADALEYAHDQASYGGRSIRLIHRDVSPQNVLLNAEGRVWLTDFGVARSAIQQHQTLAGTLCGKPSYMAPEQVVAREVDHRTDLFALGILMYESASLRRLFGRKRAVDSMQAVLQHQPAHLTEVIPGFPPDLAGTIHQALSKRAEARHQSARALARALRGYLDGADLEALSKGLGGMLKKLFSAKEFSVDARAEAALLVGAEATRVERTASAETTTEEEWPAGVGDDPLAPEALMMAGAAIPEATRVELASVYAADEFEDVGEDPAQWKDTERNLSQRPKELPKPLPEAPRGASGSFLRMLAGAMIALVGAAGCFAGVGLAFWGASLKTSVAALIFFTPMLLVGLALARFGPELLRFMRVREDRGSARRSS